MPDNTELTSIAVAVGVIQEQVLRFQGIIDRVDKLEDKVLVMQATQRPKLALSAIITIVCSLLVALSTSIGLFVMIIKIIAAIDGTAL